MAAKRARRTHANQNTKIKPDVIPLKKGISLIVVVNNNRFPIGLGMTILFKVLPPPHLLLSLLKVQRNQWTHYSNNAAIPTASAK